jgi:hypothetical protein
MGELAVASDKVWSCAAGETIGPQTPSNQTGIRQFANPNGGVEPFRNEIDTPMVRLTSRMTPGCLASNAARMAGKRVMPIMVGAVILMRPESSAPATRQL